MGNVGDYQSAVQLVVGANLAFFTFPELRQPSLPHLEIELGRWSALLRSVPATNPRHDGVRAAELEVRGIRRATERHLARVRALCLMLAAAYAVLLLWMCHAAGLQTDGRWLEAATILGALPAAAVAYINWHTNRSVAAASARRQNLEADIIRG